MIGMEMIELRKEYFPPQLLEIPAPPAKLWAQGSWPPEGTKLLAVVGSRALTRYGREACDYLIQGLAGYQIAILSGLALGADTAAHRAALENGLHTIAVPGSGLSREVLYPRANAGLAREILAAGGLLLSEQEPGHKARPGDFPSRNRIMVGLAHAVLVIEAAERSGTLITARLASDYNRDLLCVPHRIGDPHAAASRIFLRAGAGLVMEPAHILEALGIPSEKEAGKPVAHLSEDERKLYEAIEGPLARDEAIRRSGLPAHEALALLGMLELKGLLKEEFGAWRRC